MNRRQVLITVGAGAAIGIGGCIGGSDGGGSGTSPGSGTDAVETYWNALERGDAEAANEVLHDVHSASPIEEPSEEEIPERVSFEELEQRDLAAVYEADGQQRYDSEAALQRDVDALVDEIGADDYSFVYTTILIERGEDTPDGFREYHYLTAAVDGGWVVVSQLWELPEK